MFSITELPRKDGSPTGDFFVHHKSDSFTLDGFGFKFVDGVTVEPVRGRIADRLHSAYGSDVSFAPCTREDGELALAWMADHGVAPERVAEATAALDAAFSTEPAAVDPAPAPDVAPAHAEEPPATESADQAAPSQRPSASKGKSR